MGSHSVNCHLTQVNMPRHNPSQTGQYLIGLPRRNGRLTLTLVLVIHLDGLPVGRVTHPSTNHLIATRHTYIHSSGQLSLLPSPIRIHSSWHLLVSFIRYMADVDARQRLRSSSSSSSDSWTGEEIRETGGQSPNFSIVSVFPFPHFTAELPTKPVS